MVRAILRFCDACDARGAREGVGAGQRLGAGKLRLGACPLALRHRLLDRLVDGDGDAGHRGADLTPAMVTAASHARPSPMTPSATPSNASHRAAHHLTNRRA
jgi:hypothetical protein